MERTNDRQGKAGNLNGRGVAGHHPPGAELFRSLGPPTHSLTYKPGTDVRNWSVRCTCGWAHGSTLVMCQNRGSLHQRVFKNEARAWNDPLRMTEMPLWTADLSEKERREQTPQ